MIGVNGEVKLIVLINFTIELFVREQKRKKDKNNENRNMQIILSLL